MTIYDRIKQLREEKGMTQEELAFKVGYKSRSAINKIEAGLRDINQSLIVAFAKALDSTPGALMGWEDEEISDTAEDVISPTVPQRLVELFNMLNDFGKREAVKRIEELTHIPKYQEHYILAAHNDAELTDEEIEKMKKDLEDL